MKCVCGYETDKMLGFYDKEDGESFLELTFTQSDGYGVSVTRNGLNTEYKLYACPKCDTVKMVRIRR